MFNSGNAAQFKSSERLSVYTHTHHFAERKLFDFIWKIKSTRCAIQDLCKWFNEMIWMQLLWLVLYTNTQWEMSGTRSYAPASTSTLKSYYLRVNRLASPCRVRNSADTRQSQENYTTICFSTWVPIPIFLESIFFFSSSSIFLTSNWGTEVEDVLRNREKKDTMRLKPQAYYADRLSWHLRSIWLLWYAMCHVIIGTGDWMILILSLEHAFLISDGNENWLNDSHISMYLYIYGLQR